MRFRELELIRYGGFADRLLDFGDGETDLHLVIGPNEAGKSTMLSAIGDLLFGIPTQSPQNWRFDYSDLRIRGVIVGSDSELDVTRRKGRRNTLLASDGTPLPDDSLTPFLNNMDRLSFERMFGLDHAKLREGGEAILDGKDDAARIVLEAGTGFASIGHALNKLEEQAGLLYKPSAQNPLVNRLMRERTEALALVRSHALSDTQWAAMKARRDAAEDRRADLLEEGHQLTLRARAIERINRIRPLLARRSHESMALDQIGDVPRMPADAADQLAKALSERRTAQELHQLEMAKIERADSEASSIFLPEKVLSAKSEIESLYARLALTEKARADLVQRQAERTILLERAHRIRLDAGIGGAHPIPSTGTRKHLRQMLEAGRKLESDNALWHRNKQGLEDELTERPVVENEGASEASIAILRRLVEPIASDAANRTAKLIAARDRTRQKLDHLIAGLAPWAGTLDALRSTVPPGPVETLSISDALDAASALVRTARADIGGHEKELIGIRSELDALAQTGLLPTPQVIGEARAARDRLVAEVRRRFTCERAPDDDSIGRALQSAIDHADQLADRRDADARRVAQHSLLVWRRAELEERIEAARRTVDIETARLQVVTTEWDERLQGLGFQRPVPPGDLGRWHAARDQALSIADDLAEAERAFDEYQRDLEAKRNALDTELSKMGEVLKPGAHLGERLDLARSKIADLEAEIREKNIVSGRRERAKLALAQTKLEALELDGRWAKYDADRKRLLATAQLPIDWTADEISESLDAFDDLTLDSAALATIDRQIELDERHLQEFDGLFAALLGALGEPESDKPFERLRSLSDTLAAAVRDQLTLRRVAEVKREAGQALLVLEHRLRSADAIVADLMAKAGTTSVSHLEDVIERGRQALGHETELTRLGEELELQCEGIHLTLIAEEAARLSPDEAAAELEAIRIRREDIEEARETIGRELASSEAEMGSVANAMIAVDAQQEATAISASMADAAERHIEAAASAALLRWLIDRHRATAQAPLLERAGTIFTQVTGGAFSGLVLDYGDEDRPLIKGFRRDGSKVGVEAMSEGTRDQLYLALRLGAIANRGRAQPLPIICDDLLITADDRRAGEMMRVLSAASHSNQIILFSHHEHILDVANGVVGRDGFLLHRIGRDVSPTLCD